MKRREFLRVAGILPFAGIAFATSGVAEGKLAQPTEATSLSQVVYKASTWLDFCVSDNWIRSTFPDIVGASANRAEICRVDSTAGTPADSYATSWPLLPKYFREKCPDVYLDEAFDLLSVEIKAITCITQWTCGAYTYYQRSRIDWSMVICGDIPVGRIKVFQDNLLKHHDFSSDLDKPLIRDVRVSFPFEEVRELGKSTVTVKAT